MRKSRIQDRCAGSSLVAVVVRWENSRPRGRLLFCIVELVVALPARRVPPGVHAASSRPRTRQRWCRARRRRDRSNPPARPRCPAVWSHHPTAWPASDAVRMVAARFTMANAFATFAGSAAVVGFAGLRACAVEMSRYRDPAGRPAKQPLDGGTARGSPRQCPRQGIEPLIVHCDLPALPTPEPRARAHCRFPHRKPDLSNVERGNSLE